MHGGLLRDLAPDGTEIAVLEHGVPQDVPPGVEEDVIEVWRLDSEVMKTKVGNISQQLYRGAAGRVVTNVAAWESAKDLRNAFMSPEFQALLPAYPDGSAAYPHLVRPVEVPGVCLGAPWDRERTLAVWESAAADASAIEYADVCPDVPLAEQLRAAHGAFTLLGIFVVPDGAVGQAIHAYQKTGVHLKGRSGFIQAQLYRGIESSNVLVDLAVRETAGALRDALSDPGFQAVLAHYPAGTRCFRHVLRRAAVPNVCVD
ncbi:hypothetical protein GCM10010376_58580 [Streptomyces violaceusniger]